MQIKVARQEKELDGIGPRDRGNGRKSNRESWSGKS